MGGDVTVNGTLSIDTCTLSVANGNLTVSSTGTFDFQISSELEMKDSSVRYVNLYTSIDTTTNGYLDISTTTSQVIQLFNNANATFADDTVSAGNLLVLWCMGSTVSTITTIVR